MLSQPQKVTYCTSLFMPYCLEDGTKKHGQQIGGCQSLASGVVWPRGVFWDDGHLCILIVVVVTQIYAFVKGIDLYTNHHQKPILLHVNIKNIAPCLFRSPDSLLWSVRQKPEWFLTLWVCSPTAENTKVPPPGHHRCCQPGNQHWQGIHWGECRVPGCLGWGGVPKMLRGFTIQLDQWNK